MYVIMEYIFDLNISMEIALQQKNIPRNNAKCS